MPLGVTGNTPDSGSGESWFDPRRGNTKGPALVGSFAFSTYSIKMERNMETLKELADVMNAVSRQGSLASLNRITGEIRRRELRDLHASVAGATFKSESVPEEVRSVFATAQNLIVYSWFVYGFAVVAEFQAAAALELALRLRLE